MKFRITRHTSAAPPADAVELLGERIGRRRDEVSFMWSGTEIRARVLDEPPIAMTQDERIEVGRRAVLTAVAEVCERSPGLQLDWYAVAPAR